MNLKKRIDSAVIIVEASQDRLIEYRSALVNSAGTWQIEALR